MNHVERAEQTVVQLAHQRGEGLQFGRLHHRMVRDVRAFRGIADRQPAELVADHVRVAADSAGHQH